MAGQRQQLGTIRLIHLIGCIGLLFWAYWFYSQHTPARQVWREMNSVHEQRARVQAQRGHQQTVRQKVHELRARCRTIMPLVMPDFLVGTAVLAFFSVSTGVFVKRLEVFLRMSGSGQVAAVRGIGIQGQTLESNVGRKGGIQ